MKQCGSAPPLGVAKTTMLITDLGFLGYWIATALGAISVGTDPLLRQWNWSFLGLDLAAIGLGLAGLALGPRSRTAPQLLVVSLALTAAAGLMALNFYVVRGDYEPMWWIPNLWLLLFPLVALPALLRSPPPRP